MKSCGIIVEYNPFHNGHVYHAEMARNMTQSDVVIAVMSGNFLQRGEPALIDKWSRAEAALRNGVDLVVELPFAWAVQSADYFAKGGIQLLQSLHCDTLCFGTDSQAAVDYQKFGEFVVKNQTLIDDAIQAEPADLSYPQKMTNVFRTLYPELGLGFQSPNHILGMGYAKENAAYPNPMTLFPLARKAAGYHDLKSSDQSIASATAIRNDLAAGIAVDHFVPEATLKGLSENHVTWDKLWPYLKYKIVTTPTEELRKLYQVTEGLEYRIKKASQAKSFTEFIQQLKTKRYTWTRLQRLAVYLLLNVTSEEITNQQAVTCIRVLGFNKVGQAYLKEQKKALTLPLISKIGHKEAAEQFLTIRSDQVYQTAGVSEQNFGRIPLQVK